MSATLSNSVPVTAAKAGCFLHHGLSKTGYVRTYEEIPGLPPGKDELVICVPCVATLAKLIGYVPLTKLEALKDTTRLAVEKAERFEAKAAAYDMFVQKLEEVAGE